MRMKIGQMSSSRRQRQERNLSKELGILPPWKSHLNMVVFAHWDCPQERKQGLECGGGIRRSSGPAGVSAVFGVGCREHVATGKTCFL